MNDAAGEGLIEEGVEGVCVENEAFRLIWTCDGDHEKALNGEVDTDGCLLNLNPVLNCGLSSIVNSGVEWTCFNSTFSNSGCLSEVPRADMEGLLAIGLRPKSSFVIWSVCIFSDVESNDLLLCILNGKKFPSGSPACTVKQCRGK